MFKKEITNFLSYTFEANDNIKKTHQIDSLIFIGTLFIITSLAMIFRGIIDNPDVNITMFYVLGIAFVARYTSGYLWGFFFSVCSVVCINYFFTYPYHVFNMTLEDYPVTFAAMLIIYLLTSAMTTNMKKQAEVLAKQEKELMEAQKEKMRANLLRAVSHDLRTPLTGIIGNSDSYMRMEKELSQSEKLHIVENINNDANWLLNMVENLLSVTRIDNSTAKVNKSLEAVDEVVSSAVVRFKKRFPQAQLKVKLPEDVIMAMMDVMLIEQLLINLLQNSQIHSHTTKPIELVVEEYDTKILFSIRDYGIGIDEDRLETIFDGEGYNKDNNSRTDGHKGMGIGLSICKTIVKAHSGDIYVRNHTEGSEFYFYLPKETEE